MNNPQKDINKKHKEILQKFIENTNIPNDYYNDYISLFSLFLSKSNPDYKYNYTYLNEKNEDFADFLKIVRDKKELLCSVNSDARTIFENLGINHTNIYISIDDFFEASADKEIKIIDNYSIIDANGDTKNSKITILNKSQKNKNRVLTLYASDVNRSKLEKLIKMFFK